MNNDARSLHHNSYCKSKNIIQTWINLDRRRDFADTQINLLEPCSLSWVGKMSTAVKLSLDYPKSN